MKILWRRKWQHSPVFLLGESHGQKSLATVHGIARVRHDLETKKPAIIRVFGSVTPEPSPRDINQQMWIYSNNYNKCFYFINITCINFLISFFWRGDRATFAYFPFSLSSSQFSHFSHHARNHFSYSYLTVLPVHIPRWYCCLLQHLAFPWRPSNEHPGLISFRMDWLDLLAVQGTLKSLLQCHGSKASILWYSAFFIVQLSHPC